jgi:hypothetical protein
VTPAERQQVLDIAELQVNRYFDHYLSEVFPEQMDRLFKNHDDNVDAHPVQFKTLYATKRRVDRVTWMFAGGAAVVSFAATMIASHWSQLVKILF